MDYAIAAWQRQLACNGDLNLTIVAMTLIIHAYSSSGRPAEAAQWHRTLVGIVDRHLFSAKGGGASQSTAAVMQASAAALDGITADLATGSSRTERKLGSATVADGARTEDEPAGEGSGYATMDIEDDTTGVSSRSAAAAQFGSLFEPAPVLGLAGDAESSPSALDQQQLNEGVAIGGFGRFAISYVEAAKWEMGYYSDEDNQPTLPDGNDAQKKAASSRAAAATMAAAGITTSLDDSDMVDMSLAASEAHPGASSALLDGPIKTAGLPSVPPPIPAGGPDDDGVTRDSRRWHAALFGRSAGTGKLFQPDVAQPGNLALAYDYLQKVVLAGAELTAEAEELLKKLALRE